MSSSGFEGLNGTEANATALRNSLDDTDFGVAVLDVCEVLNGDRRLAAEARCRRDWVSVRVENMFRAF